MFSEGFLVTEQDMPILVRKAVFCKNYLFSRGHSAKFSSFEELSFEGSVFSVADLVGRSFAGVLFYGDLSRPRRAKNVRI